MRGPSKLIFTLAISCCVFLGCETAPHQGQQTYNDQINIYSAGDKQFSGLYNNFEFRATILNEKIIQTINRRMTKIYSWDQQKSTDELNKRLQKAQEQTRVFMSFYTPRIVDDNLTESKTIWKVYLDDGTNRYEGKVSRANKNLSEAQVIFPYHNRWGTDYFIDFPVATSAVQNNQLKFIVTGPLGRREAQFKSL